MFYVIESKIEGNPVVSMWRYTVLANAGHRCIEVVSKYLHFLVAIALLRAPSAEVIGGFRVCNGGSGALNNVLWTIGDSRGGTGPLQLNLDHKRLGAGGNGSRCRNHRSCIDTPVIEGL